MSVGPGRRLRGIKGVVFAMSVTTALPLALAWPPPAALACLPSADYDAIETADVIVEGRITGWSLVPNVTRWYGRGVEPTDDPNYFGDSSLDPIFVTMPVETVHKGQAPADLVMVALNTFHSFQGQAYWVGASGGCGAFVEDPTGKWAILSLSKDDKGYHPYGPGILFLGPEPEGADYARAVERLEARGLVPLSPAEASEEDLPVYVILPAAIILPLAALVIGSLIKPRGGGH